MFWLVVAAVAVVVAGWAFWYDRRRQGAGRGWRNPDSVYHRDDPESKFFSRY